MPTSVGNAASPGPAYTGRRQRKSLAIFMASVRLGNVSAGQAVKKKRMRSTIQKSLYNNTEAGFKQNQH